MITNIILLFLGSNPHLYNIIVYILRFARTAPTLTYVRFIYVRRLAYAAAFIRARCARAPECKLNIKF